MDGVRLSLSKNETGSSVEYPGLQIAHLEEGLNGPMFWDSGYEHMRTVQSWLMRGDAVDADGVLDRVKYNPDQIKPFRMKRMVVEDDDGIGTTDDECHWGRFVFNEANLVPRFMGMQKRFTLRFQNDLSK